MRKACIVGIEEVREFLTDSEKKQELIKNISESVKKAGYKEPKAIMVDNYPLNDSDKIGPVVIVAFGLQDSESDELVAEIKAFYYKDAVKVAKIISQETRRLMKKFRK